MDRVDTAVIGSGVIGLACAKVLAESGREVLIVESQDSVGTGISSRSSEVIHAGIYYAPGTLKASLCVQGKQLLYDYCESRRIDYRRAGKLIVAADIFGAGKLEKIFLNGEANAVDDLELMSARQAKKLEPNLHCLSALFSPSTGIIDSHQFMFSLLADAQRHGALLALRSPVTKVVNTGESFSLSIGGGHPSRLEVHELVVAGGLHSVGICKRFENYPLSALPTDFYVKGSYFKLRGRSPFSRLVYPVPEEFGLGIHLTPDMSGGIRFGPDVENVTGDFNYTVDEGRLSDFCRQISKYWRGVDAGKLAPDYSGIRPKIKVRGEVYQDFRIDGKEVHKFDGLVTLFGIDSPGLTASLAIANHVRDMLDSQAH